MFKRLFCKHNFKFERKLMRYYDFGLYGKNTILKCSKCGKEKLD